MTSQNTLCRCVSYTLRFGDELGRCGGIVSGRAEGTRSSVFDVVSVQWIISKVVYVAAERPALHVGVAALLSQLV